MTGVCSKDTLRAMKKDTLQLVEICRINPTIKLDIRYATENNFVARKLYTHARAFLHAQVAAKLDNVQKDLESRGLGLLVWDAYRPLPVQKTLWDMVPDERYVADPAKGSAHNRGAAVDVTLIDAQGHQLAMPTDFDDFSTKAHYSYDDLPANVLSNRALLRSVMGAHGFDSLATEWWHFSDSDLETYPILSVPFNQLC